MFYLTLQGNGIEFTLEQPCPGCQATPYNLNQIKNYVSLFMRKFTVKYYKVRAQRFGFPFFSILHIQSFYIEYLFIIYELF